MKKELVDSLIDGWKKFASVHHVPGIYDYVSNKGFFVPGHMQIRQLFAERAKPASDAMWDGKEKIAYAYLRKYGLSKKCVAVRAPRPVKSYVAPSRWSGKRSSPESDWKYVK